MTASEGISDYIKAGIVQKGSDGGYVIVKETKQIPFILKKNNPNYRFGYVVPRDTIKGRACYEILNMPKPNTLKYSVKSIPQPYRKTGESAERVEIQGASFVCKDGFSGGLRFDEGDQFGLYQIRLYADGALIKTIDFDVIPK